MVTRKKEEIPESFKTMEKAGEFWDTHSLADYENETKNIEMDFQITKRTRYIAIPEKIYQKLVERANRKHTTVREMLFDVAK